MDDTLESLRAMVVPIEIPAPAPNRLAAWLDAYAGELGKLANSLNALHNEMSELRDMATGCIRDERQQSLPVANGIYKRIGS